MDQRKIFSITNPADFRTYALNVFKLQAEHCAVYRQYINYLNLDIASVKHIEDIPFLPIEFFKSHRILLENHSPQQIFLSSGTTSTNTSKHHVSDLSVYEESFRAGFNLFYGDIKKYAVLALLPSYLEREGSSLIYMVDDFIKTSGHPESGYYLHNYDELFTTLKALQGSNTPIILIGVTYALLEFIENYQLNFPDLIVMETGGMKGKRREIIRQELHSILKAGFGVKSIHAEYGMTELLSQAYSQNDGLFSCPPWMKVLIRDLNDPFSYVRDSATGGINIIDLANINSCSFISTHDLGRSFPNGQFEILGRFDQSDIRGCNLMVQ